MKKILFTLGMTTLLAGCVAQQPENNIPVVDLVDTQVKVVPPENIIMQPDEFMENLRKLPEVSQVSKAEAGTYMDLLAKKLRQELRSSGVQVKEVQGQIDLIIPDKVAFGKNKTTIQNGFQEFLAAIAKLLKEYDQTMIQIIGYTDDTASVLANQQVSLQRADAIAAFLQGQEVASERIITDGAGADNPIANNATPAGRELNRRVEMTLISLQ